VIETLMNTLLKREKKRNKENGTTLPIKKRSHGKSYVYIIGNNDDGNERVVRGLYCLTNIGCLI